MFKKKFFHFILVVMCIVILMLMFFSEENVVFKTKSIPLSSDELKFYNYSSYINCPNSNSIQYLREDGGKDLFIYASPLEFSSNSITSKVESGYKCEGSYISKSFPIVWSNENNITIETKNILISLSPTTSENYTAKAVETENVFGIKNNSIVYQDVYGEGFDFICYPTLYGINTEITIPKKGNNTYEIKLNIPKDLIVDITSPDYISFKKSSNMITPDIILYVPLAVDNNDKYSYNNSLKLTSYNEDTGDCIISYRIDSDFLNAPETEYPITINQSFSLDVSSEPDTSVYSETPDISPHYLSPYLILGDSTLKGEGWSYIRFESLKSLELDSNNIKSIKYGFRNLFDLNEEAIISVYAVTNNWCSINTRWKTRSDYNINPVSSITIKKAGDYEIDLTELYKLIIKNSDDNINLYNINNGFMIKCDTPSCEIFIASGDNGLFSPYLLIETK